jgi:hypothetical protein
MKDTHICPKCNTEKNLNDYYCNKGKYQLSICKKCARETAKSNYKIFSKAEINIYLKDNNITSKICTKCNVDKPLEDFGVSNKNLFGRHSHCKLCRSKYEQNSRNSCSNLHIEYTICPKCNTLKHQSEFPKENSNRFMFHACKECYNLIKNNNRILKRKQYLEELGIVENINSNEKWIFYKLLFTHTLSKKQFIKFGITSTSIQQRYNVLGEYREYEYQILDYIVDIPSKVKLFEVIVLNRTKDRMFNFTKDMKKFPGKTECRTLECINENIKEFDESSKSRTV